MYGICIRHVCGEPRSYYPLCVRLKMNTITNISMAQGRDLAARTRRGRAASEKRETFICGRLRAFNRGFIPRRTALRTRKNSDGKSRLHMCFRAVKVRETRVPRVVSRRRKTRKGPAAPPHDNIARLSGVFHGNRDGPGRAESRRRKCLY